MGLGQNEQPFFEPGDDEDIKIAPAFGSLTESAEQSETEEEAQRYLCHKANGNVDKARTLGSCLANMVVEDIPAIEGHGEDWMLIDHIKILYIFVAEQTIRECAPDSILSQISLSAFRELINEDIPGAYEALSASRADTFYQLSYYRKPKEQVASNMGFTLAHLYGQPNDWEIATIGEHLFSLFQEKCCQECEKVQYIPCTPQ